MRIKKHVTQKLLIQSVAIMLSSFLILGCENIPVDNEGGIPEEIAQQLQGYVGVYQGPMVIKYSGPIPSESYIPNFQVY